MTNELDYLIDHIDNNPLFQRLKEVSENHEGYHDHESIYAHSVKTAKLAKELIGGSYITDQHARELFLFFVNENIYGMSRGSILILVALLHDCGKILSYIEGGVIRPILTSRPQTVHQTMSPGHEYWGGSIIVPELLSNLSLDHQLKSYIMTLVEIHDVFNSLSYFMTKVDWTNEEIVNDVKSRAKGLYIEALFNAYCDCYTANAFKVGKNIIEKLFNTSSLYAKREYVISQ